MERIQLGQHLFVGLGARYATVQFDNIAELAGEGAAARELHAYAEIVFELQQIEPRDRALGDVNLELGGLEDTGARALVHGSDKVADDVLDLAEDPKIRFTI